MPGRGQALRHAKPMPGGRVGPTPMITNIYIVTVSNTDIS